MKKRWIKVPFVIALAVLGLFTFSGIVMLLWNGVLAAVLHISTVTLWQAMGILVLSKILFRGLHRPGGGGWWRRRIEKWHSMTEEEKEQFRNRMRHCGRRAEPGRA